MLLEGHVAVVTGGSSGNGRAIARAFARAGARVVVADLTETPREGGETTGTMINADTPDRARFLRCDVTRAADLAAAVALAEDWGGLTVMVNNAGILMKEPILTATEAVFDRMIDVNVRSVFLGSQAAARVMVPRGRGVILNMGSIAGMRGTGGFAHYNMTKGAVRLLSYALADELGPHGIRVVCVAPGIMATQMNVVDDPVIGTAQGESYLPMIPARRWGTPGEVGQACVYLASDMASYVTGITHVVDGGYLRI
jgi:NAD(P)-dependent dehydrogenase (short-subunit alcohol dehydrogenase family)